MKSGEREDSSIKWQKIAAFLLVIALLLPLLVTAAGPLSSDGAYLNPDNQEFWSSVEFYENDSLPTMDETSCDSIAVNWGSRVVPLNLYFAPFQLNRETKNKPLPAQAGS